MPINLGSGAIASAKLGSTDVSKIMLGATEVYAPASGGGGITPNMDNRARFYLPAGATSFSVGAASSTGYIRLTDGTNFGAVGGSNYYAGSSYWYSYQNSASISSLTGTPVIQLFSCDASGSPSGVLYAVNLTGTTQAVDAVDLSGITTLTNFSAYSSAAYTGNFLKYGYSGASSFPSSTTELRAVGVSLGGPTQNAPNSNYAPMTYYYAPGVDITDQDLDAAALDQFYSDLGTATTNGQQIIVRLNPGASGDTPSIATAKNYTVYGS